MSSIGENCPIVPISLPKDPSIIYAQLRDSNRYKLGLLPETIPKFFSQARFTKISKTLTVYNRDVIADSLTATGLVLSRSKPQVDSDFALTASPPHQPLFHHQAAAVSSLVLSFLKVRYKFTIEPANVERCCL